MGTKLAWTLPIWVNAVLGHWWPPAFAGMQDAQGVQGGDPIYQVRWYLASNADFVGVVLGFFSFWLTSIHRFRPPHQNTIEGPPGLDPFDDGSRGKIKVE